MKKSGDAISRSFEIACDESCSFAGQVNTRKFRSFTVEVLSPSVCGELNQVALDGSQQDNEFSGVLITSKQETAITSQALVTSDESESFGIDRMSAQHTETYRTTSLTVEESSPFTTDEHSHKDTTIFAHYATSCNEVEMSNENAKDDKATTTISESDEVVKRRFSVSPIVGRCFADASYNTTCLLCCATPCGCNSCDDDSGKTGEKCYNKSDGNLVVDKLSLQNRSYMCQQPQLQWQFKQTTTQETFFVPTNSELIVTKSRRMSDTATVSTCRQQHIKSILKRPRRLLSLQDDVSVIDSNCLSSSNRGISNDRNFNEKFELTRLSRQELGSDRKKRVSFSEIVTKNLYKGIEDSSKKKNKQNRKNEPRDCSRQSKRKSKRRKYPASQNDVGRDSITTPTDRKTKQSNSEKLKYYRQIKTEKEEPHTTTQSAVFMHSNKNLRTDSLTSYEDEDESHSDDVRFNENNWWYRTPCERFAKRNNKSTTSPIRTNEFSQVSSDESGFESLVGQDEVIEDGELNHLKIVDDTSSSSESSEDLVLPHSSHMLSNRLNTWADGNGCARCSQDGDCAITHFHENTVYGSLDDDKHSEGQRRYNKTLVSDVDFVLRKAVDLVMLTNALRDMGQNDDPSY